VGDAANAATDVLSGEDDVGVHRRLAGQEKTLWPPLRREGPNISR
jgi:hypothetical protein